MQESGLGQIVGYCFGGGILVTMAIGVVLGVARVIKDAKRAKRLRKLDIVEPKA